MDKHFRLRRELMHRQLPTRLVNVLVNMMDYGGGENWPQILNNIKADPDKFELRFMRMPGAGRVSYNQLMTYADEELRGLDHAGKTLWLSDEDLQRINDTLDEACRHCPESLKNELHIIKAFFKAQTIHTKAP